MLVTLRDKGLMQFWGDAVALQSDSRFQISRGPCVLRQNTSFSLCLSPSMRKALGTSISSGKPDEMLGVMLLLLGTWAMNPSRTSLVCN